MDSFDIPLDSMDGIKDYIHSIFGTFYFRCSTTPRLHRVLEAELSAPPFSPARSALTRLPRRSMMRSHWNGSPGDGLSGTPPPQFPPSRPKLTQAEAGELVKFEANYPGELICEQTMPSLTFLSAVKELKIWNNRTHTDGSLGNPEYPSKSRRNSMNPDRPALLRSLKRLEDCETIDQPCNYIPTSGPGESHVIKFEHLFAIALAMVDAAHLLTLKRFNHKFQQLALAVPRDSALRPPSLQEVLGADRAIWAPMSAVKFENEPEWSPEWDHHLPTGTSRPFTTTLKRCRWPYSHPRDSFWSTMRTAQGWRSWSWPRQMRWNSRIAGSGSTMAKALASGSKPTDESQGTSVGIFTFAQCLTPKVRFNLWCKTPCKEPQEVTPLTCYASDQRSGLHRDHG